MDAKAKYHKFLESIDTSVAGCDDYGDLRWHIECTASTNANDTSEEQGGFTETQWYEMALATAEFALDDWRGWYPWLEKDENIN